MLFDENFSHVLVVLLLSLHHTNGYLWYKNFKVNGIDYTAKNTALTLIGEETKTVYLSCKIESSRNIRWKWRHNGKAITPPPYIIPWQYGSVLMVRPLLKGTTDGSYDCIAEYLHLTVVGTVNISVTTDDKLPKGFPQIETNPVDVRTRRVSVDFQCRVSGKAPMHITWYQNRNPITDSNGYHISSGVHGNGVYTSNLRIKNTTKNSHSFYQCVATNSIGQVVSNHAQILFPKLRQKRSTLKGIKKCKHRVVEKYESAGIVQTSSIQSQCVKKNGSWYMHLIWNIPKASEKKELYTVSISEVDLAPGDAVDCFEAQSNQFNFDESNGFQPSSENNQITYEVSVGVYPSNGNRQDVTQIGGCPALGEWTAWDQWKECECKCDTKQNGACYGETFRTRKCISKYNQQEELNDFDCEQKKAFERKACVCKNQFSSIQGSHMTSTKSEGSNSFVYILVGVGVALVIIIILTVVIRNRRPKDYEDSGVRSGGKDVYISYLSEVNKEHRVLNLIHFISSFDVNCVIDLLCQVEINNSGGLPNWLPSKISDADKIVVILSKTYVKALNSIENGVELVPDKVCKVHTEFNLIRTIMYHSCQRTPQLVIVLDGVKKEDIPDIFRGRHHCLYPKKFENSDESCRNLMGLILDEEPLQIMHSKQ